jgi:hypothetical protein
MAEQLRRFRVGLDSVASLDGGAATAELLARALLAGLASNDTAALVSLVLTRAEFAWLYFPSHPYAQPPYEMPPGLYWLQISSGSNRGLTRALAVYGGRSVDYRGLACSDTTPTHQGDNTLFGECRVRLGIGRGQEDSVRMFGSIILRGNRAKFVSYANGL